MPDLSVPDADCLLPVKYYYKVDILLSFQGVQALLTAKRGKKQPKRGVKVVQEAVTTQTKPPSSVAAELPVS